MRWIILLRAAMRNYDGWMPPGERRVTRSISEGAAMVVSVDMNAEEIARLKSITHSDSDAGAITSAAREYLRQTELRQLKAAPGRVDFALEWQELERLELQELETPSS
jgi:hypothetical protein